MAMKDNIQDCFPLIDKSLQDEFDFLAGASPIWIVKWLTSDKYIMKPKKRIVLYPNTKEELIKWAEGTAFSSNSMGMLKYIDGSATEKEMLDLVKEIIRDIEYENDPEELKETLRCARWNLNKTELIIKEL